MVVAGISCPGVLVRCTPAALIFGKELCTPVELAFRSTLEPEIARRPGVEYLKNLWDQL